MYGAAEAHTQRRNAPSLGAPERVCFVHEAAEARLQGLQGGRCSHGIGPTEATTEQGFKMVRRAPVEVWSPGVTVSSK